MATLTLTTQTGDIEVLSCNLTIPSFGAWQASVIADTDDIADLIGLATLTIDAEGTSRVLSGFLFQTSAFAARGRVRLIGGRGGLIQPLPAKFYKGASARLPAIDLCREADEILSSLSQGLDALLPYWTRQAELASNSLIRLANSLNTGWRVLDNGEIYIGPITRTPYQGEAQILSEQPQTQTLELDLSTYDLDVTHTLDERPIDRLEIFFDGAKSDVRARVAI